MTSTDIPQGTLRIHANYRASTSALDVYQYPNHNETDAEEESLWISPSSSPVGLFFSYKDEILNDLKNHEFGDYREFEYSDLKITVNPADADRIVLE